MVKWCYVLYLDYKGKREIRIREFDSRDEAIAFMGECDEKFKRLGQWRFSKIMKRDMSKHKTEFWL